VFAPPVATFTGPQQAGTDDLANGLTLALELDSGNPMAAVRKLGALIGPPTVVMRSGGTVIDAGGAGHAKLHAHWRLSEPTRTPEDHAKLRAARHAAALLTGADRSAASLAHPLLVWRPNRLEQSSQARVHRGTQPDGLPLTPGVRLKAPPIRASRATAAQGASYSGGQIARAAATNGRSQWNDRPLYIMLVRFDNSGTHRDQPYGAHVTAAKQTFGRFELGFINSCRLLRFCEPPLQDCGQRLRSHDGGYRQGLLKRCNRARSGQIDQAGETKLSLAERIE
jgi:hypothetical protein